ncbi:hypothetical protein NB694_004593 [Pantoea ananatis]|nr:hypothetical protein [Pantoea ananatis]
MFIFSKALQEFADIICQIYQGEAKMENTNPLAAMTFIIWFFMFIPCLRMAQKAGFGWKMALLLSFPGLHFFTLYLFAYKKWPSLPNT